MTTDSHESNETSPPSILQEIISYLKEFELTPDIIKAPNQTKISSLRKNVLDIISAGNEGWTSSNIIKLRKDIIALWNILLRLPKNKIIPPLRDICFLLMKFNINILSSCKDDQDLLLILLQMSIRTGLSFLEIKDEPKIINYIANTSDIIRDFGIIGRRMKIILDEEKSNYLLLKLLFNTIIKEDPETFLSTLPVEKPEDLKSLMTAFIKEYNNYSTILPDSISEIIVKLPLNEETLLSFYLNNPSSILQHHHTNKDLKKINLLSNILFETVLPINDNGGNRDDLIPLIKRMLLKDDKEVVKKILSYLHKNPPLKKTISFYLLYIKLIDLMYPLASQNPIPHFLLALDGCVLKVDGNNINDQDIINEIINIITKRIKDSKSNQIFNLLGKIVPPTKEVNELMIVKLFEFKRIDEGIEKYNLLPNPSPIMRLRISIIKDITISKDILSSIKNDDDDDKEMEEIALNLLLEKDLYEEAIYLLKINSNDEIERISRMIILSDAIKDDQRKKEVIFEMVPLLIRKSKSNIERIGIMFRKNILNSCWNCLCELREIGDGKSIILLCDWSIELLELFFNPKDNEEMQRFVLFCVVMIESLLYDYVIDDDSDDSDDDSLRKYIKYAIISLEYIKMISISIGATGDFKEILMIFLFINDEMDINELKHQSLMIILQILLKKDAFNEKVYTVLDHMIVGGGDTINGCDEILMLLRGMLILCMDYKKTIRLIEKGLEIAQIRGKEEEGGHLREDVWRDEIAWLIVHSYNTSMRDDIDVIDAKRLCQLSLALCTLLNNHDRSHYEEEIKKHYYQLLI